MYCFHWHGQSELLCIVFTDTDSLGYYVLFNQHGQSGLLGIVYIDTDSLGYYVLFTLTRTVWVIMYC